MLSEKAEKIPRIQKSNVNQWLTFGDGNIGHF